MSSTSLEPGSPAPDFSLPDSDGNSVSLADFAGGDLILYFYPKDDTPGCTKEACGFRDLWSEIARRRAAVIGVSPDDGASHQKFIADYKLPFTLLCDPDKEMMRRYGAWGEKISVRQKEHRRNSYNRLDRPRWHHPQTLEKGRRRRSPSGACTGGTHRHENIKAILKAATRGFAPSRLFSTIHDSLHSRHPPHPNPAAPPYRA